jgi:hypothetical protein
MESSFQTSGPAKKCFKRAKRTKRSKQDKLALCRQRQSSGLSKSAFCRQKKLPISSFAQWCYTLLDDTAAQRTENVEQESTNFEDDSQPWQTLSVHTVDEPIDDPSVPENDHSEAIKITLPNGLDLYLHVPLSHLHTLISELSHATTTPRP